MLIRTLRSGGMDDETIRRVCFEGDTAAMERLELDEQDRHILAGILNQPPRQLSAVLGAAAVRLSL